VGHRVVVRNYALTVATIALAICVSACSNRPQQGVLAPVAATNTEGTSLVPVLVATTRKRTTEDAGEMFGRQLGGQLSYASLTVSIPPDDARKIGEVQWPASLPGDPRQNFVTVSANDLDKQSFEAALAAAAKRAGGGKVLVFVHGFNNRFDEAVYRFAQIVHDSRAPATPVLFSWPSRGILGLRAYQEDLEGAKSSRDAMVQLLETIEANPNVNEINVVCHSMGCLLTLEALWSMGSHPGKSANRIKANRIKNVLLVAPDVDFAVFRAQMQRMHRPRPRFALFLSRDDQALKLSQSLSGGKTRVGGVDPDQEPYRSDFRREGIEVFDLTHLRGDSHSRAFDDVTSVMGMIERRLADGQPMTGDSPTLVDAGR
jgi:esterase/lipase superfamily enzyme